MRTSKRCRGGLRKRCQCRSSRRPARSWPWRGGPLSRRPRAPEFTDTEMVETVNGERGERRSSRQNSYAGALTMLVAGAVTFVASLSLALGPHLVPDRATGPVQHVVHRAATPPVAQAPAPQPAAVEAPVARPAPHLHRSSTDASSGGCPAADRRFRGTVGRSSRRRTGPAAAPPQPVAPPPPPDRIHIHC